MSDVANGAINDERDDVDNAIGGSAMSPAAPTTPVKDPISGPAVLHDLYIAELFNDELNPQESCAFKGTFSPEGTTAAIILAGGEGDRFGQPLGKQLFSAAGRPILSWSISAFDAAQEVGLIVVVCHPDRVEEYKAQAIDPFDFVTPIRVVPGGEIRQESAFSGLAAVPESFEFVAVHDGARPLTTPEAIEHAINVLRGSTLAAGAVVGHPAIDTLKVVDGEYIAGTPNRSLFWIAQTPQVFRAEVLRRAYSTALTEGFVGTDDSSLVERLNESVLMVTGPRDNIKVTVPEDIIFIEAALTARLIRDGFSGDGSGGSDTTVQER